MEELKLFTENLVKGIVKNEDIVKVESFQDEDGNTILEIIVHNEDMGAVIGKSGSMAKNIRTLVQACAYKKQLPKVKINIDSI